jgi:hypothetical protein
LHIENNPDGFEDPFALPTPRQIRKTGSGLFWNLMSSVLGTSGEHHEVVDPALARIRRNAAHYAALNSPAPPQTVAAVVSVASPIPAQKPPTAKARAIEWLGTVLANGPVPSIAVEALAKEAGFSARTLRRAAKAAGVRHIRNGRKNWDWALRSAGPVAGQRG